MAPLNESMTGLSLLTFLFLDIRGCLASFCVPRLIPQDLKLTARQTSSGPKKTRTDDHRRSNPRPDQLSYLRNQSLTKSIPKPLTRSEFPSYIKIFLSAKQVCLPVKDRTRTSSENQCYSLDIPGLCLFFVRMKKMEVFTNKKKICHSIYQKHNEIHIISKRTI